MSWELFLFFLVHLQPYHHQMEFQYCHQNLFLWWHHQKLFFMSFELVSSNKLSSIYMSSIFILLLKGLFSSNTSSTKSKKSSFFFVQLQHCLPHYFFVQDQRTYRPLSLFLFLLFQHPELVVRRSNVQFFYVREP